MSLDRSLKPDPLHAVTCRELAHIRPRQNEPAAGFADVHKAELGELGERGRPPPLLRRVSAYPVRRAPSHHHAWYAVSSSRIDLIGVSWELRILHNAHEVADAAEMRRLIDLPPPSMR